MKTKSRNLIQNFNEIPSPATWVCVRISKNENQVQQLEFV